MLLPVCEQTASDESSHTPNGEAFQIQGDEDFKVLKPNGGLREVAERQQSVLTAF